MNVNVFLREGLQDVIVFPVVRGGGGSGGGGGGGGGVGAVVAEMGGLVELLELLFLENLPPLAETLGGAAGDFGGDLLPLVAVLGLERNNQVLLL